MTWTAGTKLRRPFAGSDVEKQVMVSDSRKMNSNLTMTGAKRKE